MKPVLMFSSIQSVQSSYIQMPFLTKWHIYNSKILKLQKINKYLTINNLQGAAVFIYVHITVKTFDLAHKFTFTCLLYGLFCYYLQMQYLQFYAFCARNYQTCQNFPISVNSHLIVNSQPEWMNGHFSSWSYIIMTQ